MKDNKKKEISERKLQHCKELFKCFNNDINQFLKIWKQEFIDKMKPKYPNDILKLTIVNI